MKTKTPKWIEVFWGGLCAFFLPVLVSATDNITRDDVLSSPCVKAYGEKHYEEALECFQKFLRQDPENVLILLHIGMTAHELKHYQEAEKAYKNVLAKDPENPAFRFLLGKTLYHMSRWEEAKVEFKRINEDSRYSSEAEPYLKNMEQQKVQEAIFPSPQRWNLFFQTGIEYDDNVPQSPDGKSSLEESLVRNLENRGSFRATQYLWGRYNWPYSEALLFGVELSADAGQHFTNRSFRTRPTREDEVETGRFNEIRDFDYSIFAGALDLTYNTVLGQKRIFGNLRYTPRVTLTREHWYSYSNGLETIVGYELVPRTWAGLLYEIRFTNFDDEGFDARISSKDATSHAPGVFFQYYFFPERTSSIWVSYEYLRDQAEGLNFDLRGHRGRVDLLLPPVPWFLKFQPRFIGAYTRENYINFLVTPQRRTNYWEGMVELSREIWRPSWGALLLSLSYRYIREDSNIAVLDYRRQIFGMKLALSF